MFERMQQQQNRGKQTTKRKEHSMSTVIFIFLQKQKKGKTVPENEQIKLTLITILFAFIRGFNCNLLSVSKEVKFCTHREKSFPTILVLSLSSQG